MYATAVSSGADRGYSFSSKQSSVILLGVIGMARDVNLKVAGFQSMMAPAKRTDRNTSEKNKQRNPAVVGSKKPLNNLSNQLKASGRPKEFHLYIGNLDPSSTMEQIWDNLTPHSVCVLSCDIVKWSRFSDLRSVAAHVVIDAKNKDTAFSSNIIIAFCYHNLSLASATK